MSALDYDWPALRRSAVLWAAHHGAGDDSEDVAQEALMRLWRAPNAYPGAAAFAAVHRAVRWVLRDHRKRATARWTYLSLSMPISESGVTLGDALPGGDAETEAHDALDLRDVLAALAGMGRRGRIAALVAAGYSGAEAAARVGVTRRVMYHDLYRAREEIRP
jgi:DNA-directed RNA polymerase specialized sigma24 family protein